MDLIILAAGKGKRIYKDIQKNKCLITIKNKSLIKKIVDDALKSKIFNKIKIVVGYKKENIFNELKNYDVEFIVNKEYSKKEMLFSLKLGIQNLNNDALITYSDIYYSHKIFEKIANSKRNNYIVPVFKNWKNIWLKRNKNILDDCESLKFDKNFYLKEIGKKINSINEPMGQFMGLFYIPQKKIDITLKLIQLNLIKRKIHTTDFINLLINKYNEKIFSLIVNTYWYEFDDYEDLKNFQKNTD